jgi:hypothetical protein
MNKLASILTHLFSINKQRSKFNLSKGRQEISILREKVDRIWIG